MSIISAVKTYMLTYSSLDAGAPMWVDFLGTNPTQYAIVPLPGPKVVAWYLHGGSMREFPFAFQSMQSTADELERLENSGFYEALSDWFETQTKVGTLPTSLGTGRTATAIEAIGWAFLYEQGESATGVYQINCKLSYEQDPL